MSTTFSSILFLVLEYVSIFFMVFGGIVPYVPQYQQIRRTGNSQGFSLYVCLSLLLANILRILFWFCKRFELPLLVQSFVMITAMLTIVHVSVAARQRGGMFPTNSSHPTSRQSGGFLSNFWNWPDMSSYVTFLLLFTLISSAVTYALSSQPTFVELLGLTAVLCEAMLGAPQFYRNWVNKSTAGMSVAMVTLWTAGDLFKTTYFVARSAPAQFWLCGLLQIGIDLAVFGQVYAYSTK